MKFKGIGARRELLLGTVIFITAFSLTVCSEKTEESRGAIGKGTVPSAPLGKASSKLKWLPSLPDALRLARDEGKPVMIDFFSPRCVWCKVLDQKTYLDPEVQKLSDKFILVKVYVDRDYRSAAKYRVAALPTVVFLNSKGTVIHRVVGFRDARPFLAEMKKALSKS